MVIDSLKSMAASWWRRIQPLLDPNAWLLIAPVVVGLYFIDAALVKTLLQWALFISVICGLAIIMSRIVFPQVKLTQLMDMAKQTPISAAIVVAALILFVGFVIFVFAIWSKP
jgi:ABC-type transport system involved in cytochrome c biogenesis permease subunit